MLNLGRLGRHCRLVAAFPHYRTTDILHIFRIQISTELLATTVRRLQLVFEQNKRNKRKNKVFSKNKKKQVRNSFGVQLAVNIFE